MTQPLQNITIRPAGLADLPAVARLWQSFIELHARLDPALAPAADGQEVFVRHLAATAVGQDAALLLVAEQGPGSLVGYGLARQALLPPVFAERRHGVISDLMVSAGCRRQGIGEQLAGRMLAWLRGRGETRIEVRVLLANRQAVAFWRRFGLEPRFSIGVLAPDGPQLAPDRI